MSGTVKFTQYGGIEASSDIKGNSFSIDNETIYKITRTAPSNYWQYRAVFTGYDNRYALKDFSLVTSITEDSPTYYIPEMETGEVKIFRINLQAYNIEVYTPDQQSTFYWWIYYISNSNFYNQYYAYIEFVPPCRVLPYGSYASCNYNESSMYTNTGSLQWDKKQMLEGFARGEEKIMSAADSKDYAFIFIYCLGDND